MMQYCMLFLLGMCYSLSIATAQQSETFMISYGITESQPQEWHGLMTVTDGAFENLTGYRFGSMDQAINANEWSSRTQLARIPRGDTFVPLWYSPVTRKTPVNWSDTRFPPEHIMKAVLSRLTVSPGSELKIQTPYGEALARLSELTWGKRQDQLNSNMTIQRTVTGNRITAGSAFDRDPVIGIDDAGVAWTAWSSFDPAEEKDHLYAMPLHNNNRAEVQEITDRPGEYHTVQAATDGQGRLWFVWSTGVDCNWELYARYLQKGKWSGITCLTHSWNGDGFHHMAAGPDGRLWLVWQSLRNNNSDIYLMSCTDGAWSEPVPVSTDPANDWEPRVAVDSKGTVWIAWDSYRNGNYDIFLRSYVDGVLSETIPVTYSRDFEARVSMAIDRKDRLWLAWDHGDDRWGKDNPGSSNLSSGAWKSQFKGMEMRQNSEVPWQAGGLRRTETIDVQVYENGIFYTTAQPLTANFHPDLLDFQEFPILHADASGNIWLFFRHCVPIVGKTTSERNAWNQHATFFNGTEWTPPVVLPRGNGLNHDRMAACNMPDGTLQLVWHTDARGELYRYTVDVSDVQIDRRELLFAGSLKPPAVMSETPALTRVPLPGKPAVPKNPQTHHTDRHGPVQYDGKTYRIYWGDLHRHTDISNDGAQDGTLVDHFRWCLDAGDTDFGAVTDHSPVLHQWWRTQKMTDFFHLPNTFVSLYMYERSRNWPLGHRNILNLEKGVKVHPTKNINGQMPRNEVEYFWESVRDEEVVSIPHTTASSMGTQWWYNNDEMDRVVEIFQGDRLSYEYVGAPKSDASVERYKEGTVWNALSKGYKFGFIAASDHQSSHLSYGAVLSTELSREGIYRAIRDRRTYAATDTILVDMRVNGRMMGENLETSEVPTITVDLKGTDIITNVWIIKDNTFLYSLEPQKGRVSFTYTDKQVTPGSHYYYVRVQQADDAMAWGSPVFVEYSPQK